MRRTTRAAAPRRAASLTHGLVNRLEKEILSGALRPGERLVEESLSARFGTSRTPVREVLRILEAKGLVTTRVSRGAHVREISWKEIEDLLGRFFRHLGWGVAPSDAREEP